jgi:malonyl-CoA/methylmalonyl-CoA synthetase
MLFGVPTMYRRLADAAEQDAQVAAGFGRAWLLVSGSGALPPAEHARIEALTGQRTVERYGMTETLMNASARADGDRRAGFVGLPLHGVQTVEPLRIGQRRAAYRLIRASSCRLAATGGRVHNI